MFFYRNNLYGPRIACAEAIAPHGHIDLSGLSVARACGDVTGKGWDYLGQDCE
jgi:hypothetical protein